MSSVQYRHHDAVPHTAGYLWPVAINLIEQERERLGRKPRILDLGCGVGYFAQMLHDRGFQVTGVDPAESARVRNRQAGLSFDFRPGGDSPDSLVELGQFDVVCSLEVIEHVYSPPLFLKSIRQATSEGSLCILSTPYHGYLKNLAIALSGGFDRHFTALWEGGHIKFWSERTLRSLLESHGFRVEGVRRVGRVIPALAKSMVVSARRGD